MSQKAGIKPVAKGGAAPIAGRRAAGKGSASVASLGAAANAPKGRGLSKANKDAKSQPALREQGISAQHLLSLLGPSSSAIDLRGMFSREDERAKPAINPRIHEFAPIAGQKGGIPPRGRRASDGEEDIITGVRKRGYGAAAASADYNEMPPPNQYQPSGGYPPNNPYDNYSSHNSQPNQSYSTPNYPPQYNNPPPSFPHQQHPPQQHNNFIPPHLAVDPHAGGGGGASTATGVTSPVAKNRAKAMGSTIFSGMAQPDDLPSNTITGHFRGRVGSAAPVLQNNIHNIAQSNNNYSNARGGPGSAETGMNPYSNYISNSSMMNRDPRGRPAALPYDEKQQQQQQQHGPQRDPYARQQHHQNPYDTRDPSIYTQRERAERALYEQQQGYGRGLQTGRGDAQYYSPPHSPSRNNPGGHGYYPSNGDGAYGNNPGYYDQQGGGYPSDSPPRSPQHIGGIPNNLNPRHSWGGGDVSQYEAGSAGAKDETRRKQEDFRAILDAQVREKQGGAPGGAASKKSTKYALRHRERQAELAMEQQKMFQQQQQQGGSYGGGNNYNTPPHQHQQPPQQGYYGQPPPHQHQQGQPMVGDNMLTSPHARIRSDLHAGSLEANEGLTEKMKAQVEFRRQLAEQVAEKERKKAEEKWKKDEEDRVERIKLGFDPLPQHEYLRQQQQQHGAHQQHHHHHGQAHYEGDDGIQTFPPGQNPPAHLLHQQQHQQQYGAPSQISPTAGGAGSPSKVAENRGKQMHSSVFTGDGETDAEKKARERSIAQAAFSEQVAARKAAKQAELDREAELERKDNERIQRERLEMLNRFQGLDPAAAAAKAQQAIHDAKQKELHQHQGGGGGDASVHQPQSPSNAKTMERDFGAGANRAGAAGGFYENDPSFQPAPEEEENIAKLTALTSAMNRKVDARRAAAQHFEDSGLVDEEGNEANLDQYEEVPRKKDGVADAGRRGGKAGPSNAKVGAGGASKKKQRAETERERDSGAGASKLRAKSASRNDRESRAAAVAAQSKKKKDAAQREKEREAEVKAAADRRKASILARARREVEEVDAEQDPTDDDEYSRRSRRNSVSRKSREPSRSRKESKQQQQPRGAAAVSKKKNQPQRDSSARSQSQLDSGDRSHSRHHHGRDQEDLDVEIEHYNDVRRPHHHHSKQHHHHHDEDGAGFDSNRSESVRTPPSRIPAPRVQSGKKRAPLESGYPSSHSAHYASSSSHHHHGHHSPGYHTADFGSYNRAAAQQQRNLSPNRSESRLQEAYPWFANGVNIPLDASLSGNSAFIMLPSSNSLYPNSINDGEVQPIDMSHSGHASRAASQLRNYTVEDDGILPDELEKLMQHYGQTVGLESVFDANISPASAAAAGVPAARIASARAAAAARSSRASATGAQIMENTAAAAQGGSTSASQRTSRQHSARQHTAGSDGRVAELPSAVNVGESLEVGSHEWLQGSLLSPSDVARASATSPSGALSPERALSPGANVMQSSHHTGSRSSLHGGLGGAAAARPMPRVVDPFAIAPPDMPPASNSHTVAQSVEASYDDGDDDLDHKASDAYDNEDDHPHSRSNRYHNDTTAEDGQPQQESEPAYQQQNVAGGHHEQVAYHQDHAADQHHFPVETADDGSADFDAAGAVDPDHHQQHLSQDDQNDGYEDASYADDVDASASIDPLANDQEMTQENIQ